MTSILSLAGGQPADTGFYSQQIEQSLRFENADSAHLTISPATNSTNGRNLNTTSFWVKRGNLGSTQMMYAVGSSFPSNHNDSSVIQFLSDDTLRYRTEAAGSATSQLDTTRVFRDVSSWYHIHFIFDRDNATESERLRLYINGVRETVFDTANYPTTSQNSHFTNNKSTFIGRSTGNYFDGYIAEFVSIDSAAVSVDSFGELKDSIWVPKNVSGLTFGQNGFHLDFADSSAIGNDISGNNNDLTPSGLVASDVVLDSPTNGFPTANPLAKSSMVTLSEGNLKVAGNSASNSGNVTVSPVVTSGKWYFEYLVAKNDGDTNYPQIAAYRSGLDEHRPFINGGPGTGGQVANFFSLALGLTNGDILGIAVDADGGTVKFYDNNSYISGKDIDISAYDSTGIWIGIGEYNTGFGYLNFGQDSSFAGNKTAQGNGEAHEDFFYTPPSGYSGLNLKNFDEPAIIDASEYFNTVLYTGTSAENAITGVGFQPDFSWFKDRGNTTNHLAFDSVRGATKTLRIDDVAAETTNAEKLKSFDSDGFTLGTDNNPNGSARGPFVAWNWKAGGTAVSNTSGSTASNVSANTDAGFSIVTWFANAATGTVGHGLNSAPELVIAKPRDDSGTNWYVMHTDALTASQVVNLDSNTAAFTPGVAHFNSTYPTSSVISYGGYMGNALTNNNKLAYCFHSVEGFSKVGMYIGNSSADGTYVNTGFKVAWLMVKDRDNTGSWYIWDNKRSAHNEMNDRLVADLSAAEVADREVDFLSNGFKLRESNIAHNGSGREYIYLAFAEQPFKYANAR